MGRPRQTHCQRGHALGGRNLYVDPAGKRTCVACKRHATERRLGRKVNVGVPGRPRSSTCWRGLHHLSGDNLYVGPNGTRSCRTCTREAERVAKGHRPRSVYDSERHAACKRGHPLTDEDEHACGRRMCKRCARLRPRIQRHIRHVILLGGEVDEIAIQYAARGWDMSAFIERQTEKLKRLKKEDPWQLGKQRLRTARSELSRTGRRRGKRSVWPLQTEEFNQGPSLRT